MKRKRTSKPRQGATRARNETFEERRIEKIFFVNPDGSVNERSVDQSTEEDTRIESKRSIKFTALGAAQEVGKSCLLVEMESRLIMLDCGIHLGFTDHKRNPSFAEIGDINRLSCVVITHFHLDHCAALPVLTEQLGYTGPIFMTTPTRSMCKIMLQDYRSVMTNRFGSSGMFTDQDIQKCLSRVTCVEFKERFCIPGDDKLSFVAFHAGHVLGAAMIAISAPIGLGLKPLTVVYTGDYNMTPDRYLAAAKIPRFLPGTDDLKPDILITESTYATTIRDSRLVGETDMLRAIHRCVLKSGKVLIPVMALGRIQELCKILDTYWERSRLSHIPVYYSSLLAKQGTECYSTFVRWNGLGCKSEDVGVLKHVKPWPYSRHSEAQLTIPGPMVLFATSAMLEGGLSLTAFEHWATSKNNLILFPGHCQAGTKAGKVLSGKPVETKDGKKLQVKCEVKKVVNFSAHTDGKGIVDLIRTFAPKLAILVHGDKNKMNVLKKSLENIKIKSYYPALNETVRFTR